MVATILQFYIFKVKMYKDSNKRSTWHKFNRRTIEKNSIKMSVNKFEELSLQIASKVQKMNQIMSCHERLTLTKD